MGTYYRWYVDVNTEDPDLISSILSTGRNLDKGSGVPPTWDKFCFRITSDPTKWSPKDLVKSLSEHYPTLIFSVQFCSDNYATRKFFVCNGRILFDEDVFPQPSFPNISVWNRALKRYDKKMEDLKKKRLKNSLEKEKAAREKRIRELESELAELKKK